MYTKMAASYVEYLLGRLDHVVDRRQGSDFQTLGVWHGHIGSGHSDHRCVQMEKYFALHHPGADFRSDAALRPTLLDGDQVVGFGDRLGNRVEVQRSYRAQINYFGVDSLASQHFGSLQGDLYAFGVRYEGNMVAGLFDASFANWQNEVIGHGFVGHRKRQAVKQFVLEHHNRIWITYGRLQQPFAVFGRVGRDYLENI